MLFPRGGRFWAGLTAALCLIVATCRADDFVSIDFPIHKARVTAPGLSAPPRQVMTPEGIGYTQVMLRRPNKGERVFLTLIFQENGENGPGIFWTGDVGGEQITLVENLAEGVKGLNQRTIALPAEALEEAGQLFIMGRQDQLLRLRVDWCAPSATFVAVDRERPTLFMGGNALLEREIGGEENLQPPDVWFGPVLDAPLQEGVVDLGEPVEFLVPLKGGAGEARLRARFLGLPLNRVVKVWINGKLAGRIQPDVPSLTDPGFVRQKGKTAYAGWRSGSIFIDAGLLQEGENSVVLEAPGKEIFVRDTALEIFSTPDEPEPAATPVPELPKPTPVDLPMPPVDAVPEIPLD